MSPQMAELIRKMETLEDELEAALDLSMERFALSKSCFGVIANCK